MTWQFVWKKVSNNDMTICGCQGTIGKVLVCMQNKDASGSSEDQIQAVVHTLGADLSKTEMVGQIL